MGNRLSRNPPSVKHELLNEHSERYFERVQVRNGILSKRRRWRRTKKRRKNHHSRQGSWDEAPGGTLTDGFTMTSGDREEEFSATPTAPSIDTYLSNNNMSPSTRRRHEDDDDERRRWQQQQQRRRRKATIDGWQVKRKGNHALQLRLAKNRILQLITSGSMAPATSPISLDSGLGSHIHHRSEGAAGSDYGGGCDALESPSSREDLNLEFDAMISTGMVWVEVARTTKVSAVAMSRSRSGGVQRKGPLLLAVGGEDGVTTITELLDEREHHICGPTGPNSEECSSINGSSVAASSVDSSTLRKFGETLEFPIEARVRSLDFSPDGNFLAVGGDGCITYLLRVVLDAETASLQDLQVVHQVERIDRVCAVHFSPDSKLLAVGGFDGKVAIFAMSSLVQDNTTPLVAEISRTGLVLCLEWSPCGRYIAIGGSDKCCAVVDSVSWKLVNETLRSASVQSVKWNPDGTCLAIGDRDMMILDCGDSFSVHCEICNTKYDQQESYTAVVASSKYRISSLCWSPDDGKYLAVGGTDGSCMVVETRGYALVHEVRRQGDVSCLAWGQFQLPNGDYRRYLAIGDETSKVALLKAGTETDGSVSESDDLSSAASSRASSYLSTESDWVFREDSFRDVEDPVCPSPHPHGLRPQRNITSVAFSRASKYSTSSYLAFASDDCSLTIMATEGWRAVFQMEFAKPIRTIAFSNSNNYLALGGDEGVLYVLSMPSRSMVVNTIFNSPILSLGFSKLDRRLAVGSADGVLALLCPEANWEPVGEIEHSEAAILSQDWSTSSLAVGREDGSVTVFETENVYSNFFVPLAELSMKNPVRAVALGASGRFLAVAGDGGTLSIFSAKGGWVLCHQIRVGARMSAVKWCPSGRYIAFAAKNRMTRIIDTISWADVEEARGAIISMSGIGTSSNDISSIDWSMDGKWIVFGSGEGRLNILDTDDWKLLSPSVLENRAVGGVGVNQSNGT